MLTFSDMYKFVRRQSKTFKLLLHVAKRVHEVDAKLDVVNNKLDDIAALLIENPQDAAAIEAQRKRILASSAKLREVVASNTPAAP